MSKPMTEPMMLTADQIAAAGNLHATLEQWRRTDNALTRLRDVMPGFGPEESLLKVTAINALYGTNVFALVRAAEHVVAVLRMTDVSNAGPELVEALADIPTTPMGRQRRHVSFASKFAHFFISDERFAIYDSFAEQMLSLHIGGAALRDPAHPYKTFIANLEVLRRAHGLRVGYRELDRYLWLAGQYRAYARGKRGLNAELLRVFERPAPEQRVLLSALQPF